MTLMGKLRERYILWRLTPAEQLVYRALKHPEEWESRSGSYTLHHKRSSVGIYVGDYSGDRAKSRARCRIESPVTQDYDPSRFAKKVLFRMARDIKYPPPPSNQEVGKNLFKYLMTVELGEGNDGQH